MKVIIQGSGRMGIRHAQGIIDMPEVFEICIVDKYETALKNAEEILGNSLGFPKVKFQSLSDFINDKSQYDIAILAATSQNRIGNCQLILDKGVKHILIEKPLGQSIREVNELVDFFEKNKEVKAYVNLNMRLYESFISLKTDLQNLPQFKGPKTITLNTGSIGIGANGIHYLDLVYFLFDADDVKIKASEIDKCLVPSTRGAEFVDFGGWVVIDFFKKGNKECTLLINISSQSSVFGGWDIVGQHGRILINEIQQNRIDILRKEDSKMPVNRYAVDYLDPVEKRIESPFLGDLTYKWLNNLLMGNEVLPQLKDSLKVHQLMFDWLSVSETHQDFFPIT
jgi:predicted dehydrogenase